jgi:hypothetical protein
MATKKEGVGRPLGSTAVTRKRPSDEVLIKLITAKHGNKSEIARAIGVARGTVQGWIRKNKKLAKAVEDIKESMIDFTESQMMLLIQGIPKYKMDEKGERKIVGWVEKPDPSLIKYHLGTLAKDRGYVTKEEKEVKMEGTIIIDFSED